MKQFDLFNAPTVSFDPQGTILLLLQRSRLGPQRKINLSKLENLPPEIREELVSATAKILKCPELSTISGLDSSMDRWISRNSLPSLFKFGAYLFSENMLKTADAKLVDYQERRNLAVLPFVARYSDIKNRSIAELGPMLSLAVAWPDVTTVSNLFSLRWRWLTIGLPEKLSTIDPDIAIREQARLVEDLKRQEALVVSALAKGLKALVDRMVTTLTPAEDGRRKVFRDSLVVNFREFLEAFPNRYVVENKELEALVNQAEGLLGGLTPDELRENPELGPTLAQGMAEIADRLEPLVAGSRVIIFDEEVVNG